MGRGGSAPANLRPLILFLLMLLPLHIQLLPHPIYSAAQRLVLGNSHSKVTMMPTPLPSLVIEEADVQGNDGDEGEEGDYESKEDSGKDEEEAEYEAFFVTQHGTHFSPYEESAASSSIGRNVIDSPLLGLFLDDLGAKKVAAQWETALPHAQVKTTRVVDVGRSGADEEKMESYGRGTASQQHVKRLQQRKLASTRPSANGPSLRKNAMLRRRLEVANGMDVRVERIAHFYVMPSLLLIGFVNQCLNIATLSTLAPPGYLYLKASAFADVLSMLAIIPFCMRHGDLHNPHSYLAMLYHAHVELPLINSLITASALCLVGMTIDRYISIRHPIAFFNATDSRSRIRFTIVVIFATAFIIFIPSGWQKLVVPDSPPLFHPRSAQPPAAIVGSGGERTTAPTLWRIQRNHRLNHSTSFQVYLMCRELIARLGPILILVVLNAEMIRSLRRISARHTKLRVRQDELTRARDSERNRISILLLITSATFVVCTLPASMLSLFIDYSRDGLLMQIFRAFANLLQVTHFLFNFYLYALCSNEYREAFLALFGCTRGRTPSATDEQLLTTTKNHNGRLAKRAARTSSRTHNRYCHNTTNNNNINNNNSRSAAVLLAVDRPEQQVSSEVNDERSPIND